jgi:cell wall-associated NlpC family hydrolase
MGQQSLRGLLVTVVLTGLVISLVTGCGIKSVPEKSWNLRSKITRLAVDLVGLPYRLGGEDITGFDCSGFVFYVYGAFGLRIPRTAKKQGKLKHAVRFRNAKAGDILVFKIRKGWHSAIYAGDNTFIHAPNQQSSVKSEKLNHYWKSRLKKVIQIIPD